MEEQDEEALYGAVLRTANNASPQPEQKAASGASTAKCVVSLCRRYRAQNQCSYAAATACAPRWYRYIPPARRKSSGVAAAVAPTETAERIQSPRLAALSPLTLRGADGGQNNKGRVVRNHSAKLLLGKLRETDGPILWHKMS